jgi:hypothetical protein
MFKLQLKGFFFKVPIIAQYEASLYKYFNTSSSNSRPKVDDLVGIIKEKGPDYLIFKKDLKRAYRQIPICPVDLHLVGFNWNNSLFVDKSFTNGLEIQCTNLSKSYYRSSFY